jgi:hypothetical protein
LTKGHSFSKLIGIGSASVQQIRNVTREIGCSGKGRQNGASATPSIIHFGYYSISEDELDIRIDVLADRIASAFLVVPVVRITVSGSAYWLAQYLVNLFLSLSQHQGGEFTAGIDGAPGIVRGVRMVAGPPEATPQQA